MKKLGYGCMRFPFNDKKPDMELIIQLIDKFMENGYNYFDTAHVYHKGLSEKILKDALTSRYPRNQYLIADKLPIFNLKKEEDMQQIFDEQLERLSIDYFDYYMLHNVSTKHQDKFTKIDSFKFIKQKKQEGKIRHIGISCHDSPEFLEDILQNHPEIEFVQLQINYLDWEDKIIQSKKCYEIASKYDKDIIVMEPLKGGSLVNLPPEAKKIFTDYNPSYSMASWALRFLLSLDNIKVILSGMNNLTALEDNINTVNNHKKLSDTESDLINDVRNVIQKQRLIPCTSCNYCLDYCPQKIPISTYLQIYNTQKLLNHNSSGMYYRNISSTNNNVSDCTNCGNCMKYCPQQINIPESLNKIKQEFE